MEPGDLVAVHALSERVHPNYPERHAVLAEKARLFPSGCFVLDAGGEIAGYAFAHPWSPDGVPALDAFLETLPEETDAFFIHDVALRGDVRSAGHGAQIVARLLEVARGAGFARAGLVAVRGTAGYWNRAGFVAASDDAVGRRARAIYGEDAIFMQRRTEA